MFDKAKRKILSIIEDILTDIKLYFYEEGHRSAYLKYEEELKEHQRKIDKLFLEYYNNDDETIYDCYKKFNILNDYTDELGDINNKIAVLNLIEEKVNKFTEILCSGGLLASLLIAAFLNFIPGLIVFLLTMTKAIARANTLVFTEKVKKRMDKTMQTIQITFTNCVNAITKKENKRIDRLDELDREEEQNKASIKEMAEYYLDCYLGYEEVYPEMPKDVKDYLTKMLQKDLNTEVTDLETLLFMAYEKIKIEEFEEAIQEEMNAEKPKKLEKIK